MFSLLTICLLLGASASVLADLPLSPVESGSGSLGNRLLFINTTCEDEGFLSGSVLPEVKLALNVVNGALPSEITLEIDVIHVEPHESSSLSFLIKHLLRMPEAAAMLYPGCSPFTGILADISDRLFNLSVITYVFPSLPAHPASLFDHYQMFPSEKHLATGVASFVTYFNWKRAVILTQDIPIFTSISEKLGDSLEPMSVNVTNKIMMDGQIREEEIFPPDNRVFVLNMHPVYARAVLCEAFNSGRFYPGYVWITYGWYSDQWWEETRMNKLDNCSNEEISSVLEGTIAVTHYPTDSTYPNQQQPFTTYTSSAYDAVMFLAHEMFFAFLESNPSFSNLATFNNNGIRIVDDITFSQYRIGSDQFPIREVIGSMQPPGNLTLREGEDEFSLWPNGVPSDGTPETVENYPLLPLMVVCYTAATAGILFAIVCLIFNIVFRNKKLIRLTSPTINLIIIFGTIIFYSSVYTYFYVPRTSGSWVLVMVCNLRLWFTSIGYVLTYVPINVKMWRVFYICHKPKQRNVFMRDWHLFLIISFFVILDLILLIIVTAVDNSRYTVKIIPDKEHPGTSVNDDGITISYTVSRCHSATEPYWISVLFGYKLLMQAIGVFLAFNIRKVKIKGLNDSKEISFILYITTVLIGIVILVTFVFGDYINVDGGTYGLGITTATTVVLTFIFVPKMYGLYRDPKGENIFSFPSPDQPNNNTGTVRSQLGSCSGMAALDATDDSKIVISALHKRIKELETEIAISHGENNNMSTNPVFFAVDSTNKEELPVSKSSGSGDATLSTGAV